MHSRAGVNRVHAARRERQASHVSLDERQCTVLYRLGRRFVLVAVRPCLLHHRRRIIARDDVVEFAASREPSREQTAAARHVQQYPAGAPRVPDVLHRVFPLRLLAGEPRPREALPPSVLVDARDGVALKKCGSGLAKRWVRVRAVRAAGVQAQVQDGTVGRRERPGAARARGARDERAKADGARELGTSLLAGILRDGFICCWGR